MMINKSNKELVNKMITTFFSLKNSERKMLNDTKDVTKGETMVLMCIDYLTTKNDEYVGQSTLVEELKISKTVVSNFISSLEEKEYIEKVINKENKREHLIKLTEIGRKNAMAIKKKHYELIEGLVNYIGVEDSEIFIEVVKKVKKYMEEKGTC